MLLLSFLGASVVVSDAISNDAATTTPCVAPRITDASVAVGAPRAVLDFEFSGGYSDDACEQWRLRCDNESAAAGNGLHLNFTSFETASHDTDGYVPDKVVLHDGDPTPSAQLAALTGWRALVAYHVAASGLMTVSFASENPFTRDGFVAEYWCGPVPPLPLGTAASYTIAGAPDSEYNGVYRRLSTVRCNDKPVFMPQYSCCSSSGYDHHVLFQPTGYTYWMIGSGYRLADCDNRGYARSNGNGGSCPSSPDGAGCGGLWQAVTYGCGSSWCDAPTLTVTAP